MQHEDFIIGFDVRVPRGSNEPWHDQYLLRSDVDVLVSVDPMVFPVPDDSLSYSETTNALGLLSEPPELQHVQPGCWGISVTALQDVHDAIEKKYGILTTSASLRTAHDLITNNWMEIGYDVIDVRGLISGLLNCGPHGNNLVTMFSHRINKFGVFDIYRDALEYSKIRGDEIPAHSPFYPALIWKQRQ